MEIMVSIFIMSILAGIATRSVKFHVQKTRDMRRKADLRQLQKGLTTYFARNGRFPSTGAPCGDNSCYYTSEPNYAAFSNNGGNWIPGLAPTYIGQLPRDPKGDKSTIAPCSAWALRSYLYTSDGNNYKLIAHCSPEGTLSIPTDPYYDPQRPNRAWMVCSGEPTACNW